jgi:outer membrane usher protein
VTRRRRLSLASVSRLALFICCGVGLGAAPAWGQAAAGEANSQPSGDESAAAAAQPAERSATLPLQLVVDQTRLGNVSATITSTEAQQVHVGDLARLLAPLITEQAGQRLTALGTGLVAVDRVAAAGIRVSLDPGTLALVAELSPEVRRAQSFQASADYQITGAERATVADFAAGLTAALVATSPLDSNFDVSASIAFSGFVNIGGVRGWNLDFGGNINLAGGSGDDFQRNRLVLFKDWPEEALRLSLGDVIPALPRFAGTSDILGVTLARDYAALQPTRNIRPTLSRTVNLDRRSIVEVYVNESLVERFQAGPGPIDINRIPLTSLSNNVAIIVEDALGRRELESLAYGSDLSLLGAGVELFSVSAGVLRDPGFGGFDYSDDPIVAGFYQRGISPALTVAGHAVLTEDVQNAGAAAGLATLFGIFTGEVAFSRTGDGDTGAALGLTYRGSPFFGVESDEIATVSLDYRTRRFTTLGQFGFLDDLKFDLRVDYQKGITDTVSAFANFSIVGRYDQDDVDAGATIGVRARLGPINANLGLRYASLARGEEDVGVFLTLSLPIGSTGNLSASYSTDQNRGRVEYRERRGLTLPELDYRIGASTSDTEQSLFGGIGYGTTRFAANADVVSRFPTNGGIDNTVGTARLQTGIGFADGVFAIGRDPSRGFAIVSRHESLADSTLTVRTSAIGRELGFANDAGPALIPISSPYRPQIVTVDAANVPVGYNVGAGRYVLESGARSGLRIEIGTDAYRSALATLIYAGEPVALASGRFVSVDDPERGGTFFTNRTGRALFDGLAPGRYTISIEDLGLTGEFTVPEAGEVLVRIGNLEMRRQ